MGIKVISVETNQCVRILDKQENTRVIHLALFQGIAKEHRAATTIEMKVSENPVLQNVRVDPTIVCMSFKKIGFSICLPDENWKIQSVDSDRDVFNEKLSKEEVMAATQAEEPR